MRVVEHIVFDDKTTPGHRQNPPDGAHGTQKRGVNATGNGGRERSWKGE